jgi:hypothetical protein
MVRRSQEALHKTLTKEEEEAFKTNAGNKRKKLKSLASIATKNGLKLVPILDTATS